MYLYVKNVGIESIMNHIMSELMSVILNQKQRMNQLVPHKEESKMIYVIVGFALILLIAVLIIGVMCFVDYVDYCLCFLHSHKERSKQWYKTPYYD